MTETVKVKDSIEQSTVDGVRSLEADKYKYGFDSDIEQEFAPKGLNEDIVRFISAKKDEPEWLLDWRLEAYRRWLTLEEPEWAMVDYPKIDFQSTKAVRDLFEAKLAEIEPELVIFGGKSQRLPNTSFFAVPDASSMTLMMALDLEGISVSTGTACSSGKTGESKSIRAMGRSDEAPKGAIRVSFGINNTCLLYTSPSPRD